MSREEVIERNSVRCDACLDEIESTHRHDFKTCGCGRVHVDGGRDYRKRGYRGDGGPAFTDTSIFDVWEVEYDWGAPGCPQTSRVYVERVEP